jgi:hypothetical protein
MLVSVLLLPAAAQAESTLTTPHFTVSLKENCEEGVVGCDDVTYHGVSRKTGKAITLKGKTNMVMCADGETPCHIGNYEFKSGAVLYAVYPNGTLIVTKGTHVLLNEKGQWSW